MPDNTKKTEPSAPADEEIGKKNFLSGLVGGNYDDETPFDAGESNTKMVSTIAWIITFGFSILLIINNYFNVNFLQENTFRRQQRQKRERERHKKRGREKRNRGQINVRM